MDVTGRRKSIAFFIALGVGLISVILVLYIGWILLNWRTGLLLVLGFLLVLMIICGICSTLSFWSAKSAATNSTTRSSTPSPMN